MSSILITIVLLFLLYSSKADSETFKLTNLTQNTIYNVTATLFNKYDEFYEFSNVYTYKTFEGNYHPTPVDIDSIVITFMNPIYPYTYMHTTIEWKPNEGSFSYFWFHHMFYVKCG